MRSIIVGVALVLGIVGVRAQAWTNAPIGTPCVMPSGADGIVYEGQCRSILFAPLPLGIGNASENTWDQFWAKAKCPEGYKMAGVVLMGVLHAKCAKEITEPIFE